MDPLDRRIRDRRIESYFRSGMTMREIGSKFALSKMRISQILKKLGVSREHGGRLIRARSRRSKARRS